MPQYKPSFKSWHEAGFTAELLPIIPLGAKLAPSSNVNEKLLGKVPGVRREEGWVGLGGPWSKKLVAREQEAKMWDRWGAYIGFQCRTFTFSDIDVSHKETADTIVALAFEHLGPTAIRYRSNSAKVALIYHCPDLRKRRIAFRIPGIDDVQAVEQLGAGQYANVDGIHPSGERYKWSGDAHPLQLKAAGIPKVTEEQVNKFFAAVANYLDMMGYEIVKSSGSDAAATPRRDFSGTALQAPSPERVLEVLRAVKCNEETFTSRDDLVRFMPAVKAALGDARDEYWPIVLDWLLQYPGAEEDYLTKMWVSFKNAALGWPYLEAWARGHGYTEGAQHDFTDEPVSADAEKGMPVTALEKALDRYIWCSSMGEFYDTETDTMLSKDAFNAENTNIADYGKGSTNSATAIWMNQPGARKVQTHTYRVGQPIIIKEGRAMALNRWRPSNFVPATNVSDEDVKPWLDHMQLIFGPVEGPTMQHVLNWLAFFCQRPGVKINHALVIYGATQGTGKDTCFYPLTKFVGQDNFQSVTPKMLCSQFNEYLAKQLVVIAEMINIEKKGTMNMMKPWLATPLDRLSINEKGTRLFSIPNTVNVIIFTNYPDAISLDDSDRRYWVHECCLGSPLPQPYYRALYDKYYDVGGNEKVIGWLLQRDISAWDEKAPPAMTDAKQEMLDQTMSRPVRSVVSMFDEGETFAGRTLLTAREIVQQARLDGNHEVTDKSATAALRRLGFLASAKKVRLSGAAPCGLWGRPGTGVEPDAFDHAALVEAYADEIKRTSGARKA